MILQTDSRLNKSINKYGCYFMSIVFLVNKHTGLELSIPIIEKLYKDCCELGYIEDSNTRKAFIWDVNSVFKHLGLEVRYNGRHDPPNYVCNTQEIEILCVRVGDSMTKHFVVGDNYGHIAYDPMGLSDVRKFDSKRVFRVL